MSDWIPDGPWRVGTQVGKNLYIEDGTPRGVDVGRMDSPALAAYVVAAVNSRRERDEASDEVLRLLAALTEVFQAHTAADMMEIARAALAVAR